MKRVEGVRLGEWLCFFLVFTRSPAFGLSSTHLVGSPNSSPASQCWRPAAYLPSNSLSADQLAHSGSCILCFLCLVLFLPVPLVLLRKHFRSEQWSLWIFGSWTHAQLHSAHLPALPPPSSWAVGHSQVHLSIPAQSSRMLTQPPAAVPLPGRSPPTFKISHLVLGYLVHPHPGFLFSANRSLFPFQKPYACVTCFLPLVNSFSSIVLSHTNISLWDFF